MLEELGPEPETPSVPSSSVAQPDDEEDEEELLLQRELQGGLRTKALIVGEPRLRRRERAPWCSELTLRPRRKGEDLVLALGRGLPGTLV